MSKLVRFGVSIEKDVLSVFDARIRAQGCPTRSKAIGDLIRACLVEEQWKAGSGRVAGVITLVYDHHRRDLVNRLTSLQHDFLGNIISSQHIHLDHCNCLEMIVVKGTPGGVRALEGRLKSTKGVKHSSLSMATMNI